MCKVPLGKWIENYRFKIIQRHLKSVSVCPYAHSGCAWGKNTNIQNRKPFFQKEVKSQEALEMGIQLVLLEAKGHLFIASNPSPRGQTGG
ncbi:MAG: hypothetical protein WA194_05305, partial [Patescibacteria group bacterium]